MKIIMYTDTIQIFNNDQKRQFIYLIFSYRSRLDVNAIEYKKFCDEIESIFTTDSLEKNPLVESEQYIAIKDVTNIRLDPEKEDRVKHLMDKMAHRVSLLHKFFIYLVKNCFMSKGSCTSFTIIPII